jgi:hypothetical protein
MTGRKENNMKNLSDTKIIVGGKIYAAPVVNWIQTANDYPRIEVEATISPFNAIGLFKETKSLTIENVIFNPPATIVFWSDKTKTVVKCDYELEPYDPEKGLAMAFAKKLMGENKYEYYNVFKHWLKKWNKQNLDQCKTPEPSEENTTEWNWIGDMCDA